MANRAPNDVDPLMVLFPQAFSVMGAMARVPAPAVTGASHTARRMALLARFVRQATKEAVIVTEDQMNALLDNLSDIYHGRSLRFSPQMGESLAHILELLAAQLAQQDALEGAGP